jgi:basic membrane lipoprotein Med (substrate-binding protein (PBP1-ABC) superfamily)
MRRMRRQAAALGLLAVLLAAGASVDASAGKQLRVGLVLQNPDATDPFQHGAFVGLQRAARTLGISGKVVVSPQWRAYAPSFAYLARKRYDLIIGLGLEALQIQPRLRGTRIR